MYLINTFPKYVNEYWFNIILIKLTFNKPHFLSITLLTEHKYNNVNIMS